MRKFDKLKLVEFFGKGYEKDILLSFHIDFNCCELQIFETSL